eukprot:TRINITY_DN12764_c0_g3_i1.p1 TRINITY_DN12764_c0_g3~~TRINITY_DN12764_c0_g3_i1.p1  ORF type:complete len:431 (+),score=126.38 TRINITY_DN12764_c0_g3_i1:277-1569(+)
MQRAKRIKALAKEVEKEVIIPLRAFISEQRKKEKEVRDERSKEELNYFYERKNFEDTKKNYLARHKEFEKSVELRLISTAGQEVKPSKRQKHSKELYKLYSKVIEAQNKCRASYHDIKKVKSDYLMNMKKHMELVQQLEEMLAKTIKVLTNLYYTKSIDDNLNENSQLQEFKKKINDEVPSEAKIQEEVKGENDVIFTYAKNKFSQLYEAFNSVTYDQKPIDTVDALSLAQADKKEVQDSPKLCTVLLNSCWYAKEVQPGKVEELKNHIKAQEGRKEFCDAFKVWRAIGENEMSKSGYKLVGDLLMLVLDEANKSDDIETVMTVLILAQTYYMKVGGKKEYLQRYIQKHKVWSKEFWEKTIKKRIEKKNEELTKEKEELDYEVYGILGAAANNMLHLQIAPTEVKQLVIQYASLNIQSTAIQAKLQVIPA